MKPIFEKETKVKPFRCKKIRKILGKEVVYEYGLVKTLVPKEFIGSTAKVVIYGEL